MDLFSDEIRERERKRRRREPLWSLLSIFLHIAFVALVILCTPVKKLVLPEKRTGQPATPKLTAERLEELSETLTTARMNELLQQIQTMQTVLHNMDAMKEAIAKDYDAFAAHEAESAREQLEKLVQETASHQAKSVEAQAIVKDEVRELVQVETTQDLKKNEVAAEMRTKRDKLMYETVEKTNTAQANAVNALDKLAVKASFTGYAVTSEAAAKLREAQVEAAKLQDAAQTEAQDVAEQLIQIAGNERFIEKQEEAIKTARNKKWHEDRLKQAYAQREKFEKVRRERADSRQVAALDRAEEAQKKLAAQLKVLEATLAADESKLKQLAQNEKRAENELVRKDASAMTLKEAYELAQALEGEIAVSYKDVKATQTAIARKMSFDEAQKITDVATPERMKPDAEALGENVRTQEALDRRKKAEAEVVREADSMVESTVAMMTDAMKIVMGETKTPASASVPETKNVAWMDEQDLAKRNDAKSVEERVAEMDAASDYQVELQNAAAESAEAKAKDLSALMTKASADAQATKGALPGPPGLKGGDLGLVPGNVMRVSARGGDGVEAHWMYVNSWYVIGPFPNPNRANLRRKFAPESVQDLDATYVGKDGRVLRWRFWQAQSSKPVQPWMADWRAEVIPEGKEEYSIYYAYAEVFFDEACDRWVAIGSDDRSDVWLNDLPIWGSSNRLKAWKLAEDFRRVHFKKGRNRILVRVENGHWNCGWSFCIATHDGL